MRNKLLGLTGIVVGLAGSVYSFNKWTENDRRYFNTPEIREVNGIYRRLHNVESELQTALLNTSEADANKGSITALLREKEQLQFKYDELNTDTPMQNAMAASESTWLNSNGIATLLLIISMGTMVAGASAFMKKQGARSYETNRLQA